MKLKNLKNERKYNKYSLYLFLNSTSYTPGEKNFKYYINPAFDPACFCSKSKGESFDNF